MRETSLLASLCATTTSGVQVGRRAVSAAAELDLQFLLQEQGLRDREFSHVVQGFTLPRLKSICAD